MRDTPPPPSVPTLLGLLERRPLPVLGALFALVFLISAGVTVIVSVLRS